METPASINERIIDAYTLIGFKFPEEPTHEDLVVGPDEVLKSESGWYIGQRCFEYLDDGDTYHGEWVGPFAYRRDTDYMTETEATELLLIHQDLESRREW